MSRILVGFCSLVLLGADTAIVAAQEKYSVGVLKGWEGEVVPLFEFRDGAWHPIQPGVSRTDSAELGFSWIPPSRWHYYQHSRFSHFNVEPPTRGDHGIWTQEALASELPTARWFLVVSDTITTPYGFTDFRNDPYLQTMVLAALRGRLSDAEENWIRGDSAGSRVGRPIDSLGELGASMVVTRLDQAPRGEWWYVRVSRVYEDLSDAGPPNCWRRTSLVGWLKLSWPEHEATDASLEFQHGGCTFKGLTSLILLGEVELEGRRFVVALRMGYESYVPIVIELSADGAVVQVEYARAVVGS